MKNKLKLPMGTSEKKKTSKIEEKNKKPSLVAYLKNYSLYRLLMGILLCSAIALLISPQLTVSTYNYKLGDISRHNIRAPQDFTVEDTLSTEKRRLESEQAVLSVYDLNSKAEEEMEKRVTTAFAKMREAFKNANVKQAALDKYRKEFQKKLRIQVSEKDFNLLIKRRFKKAIEDYILELALPFAQREVVLSKEQLFKERGRGIILRDIATNEEVVLEDFTTIIDLKEARILLRRQARIVLSPVRRDVSETILNLALKLIEPNFTFNKIETETRKAAAVQDVSPLYFQIKKGEMIIREGTRVTEATLAKLEGLTKLKGDQGNRWTIAGYFLLSFLILFFLYRYNNYNLPHHSLSNRDFIFLCCIFIVIILLIKFSLVFARAFSNSFPLISSDSYFYAIPFACGAIVISVVLDTQIAAMSSIVIAILACILLENPLIFFVYPFVSSLVAAQEVVQCRERKTLIRAGLIVGTVNAIIILALSVFVGNLFAIDTIINTGLGMLGGMLASVLATGIIPLAEIAFNYTTNIKLLELADLNQPVLRKLLISAPGTYHHSIIVGSLAEAAAEAIHTNPLLSRVSAYYHDIGKTKKPLYFVENQKGGENKHDKLLPSMSSLILISHVKDGVEVAKQGRLGKGILDIISQHHGTSCINYFYQKAKEKSSMNNLPPVSDKDFRYPGPKPQTKEAGIVMLADAVEATSKTLSDPTPARIQGMVQRIINNIFTDGQLDECELTLKDLHLIAESFNRILNGIFHARIEYPDTAEKETNGTSKSQDLDQKPTKQDRDRSAQDKTNGERDLGRIGINKSRDKHSAFG